jgi:RecB family endonuclease NucS
MRLIVARCSAVYSGRLDTVLPEALRLIMIKADGSVLLHADAGGYKPLNWMTPPTVIEEVDGGEDVDVDGAVDASDTPPRIVVRKYAGKTEDRLEITLHEVLSDVTHDMGSPDEDAGLAKDGVEAHLQELLAEQPHWCGEGLRLVRREWPTDIGPVDLMCRDADDEWVAVEIKRVAGIDAVEQLSRYLERLRADPGFESCRGVLAAQSVKPQARVLADSRDLRWVEVDLAVLRGEREPELRLFVA